RIATVGEDAAVRVWDATTGEALTPPLQHNGTVWQARFSADGRRVVAASEDATVRVWDLTTIRPMPPILSNDALTYATFSPDGRRRWYRAALGRSDRQTAPPFPEAPRSGMGCGVQHGRAADRHSE